MVSAKNDETREPDAEDTRRERSWIAEQIQLLAIEDGFA